MFTTLMPTIRTPIIEMAPKTFQAIPSVTWQPTASVDASFTDRSARRNNNGDNTVKHWRHEQGDDQQDTAGNEEVPAARDGLYSHSG
jgi:hypothetical protein